MRIKVLAILTGVAVAVLPLATATSAQAASRTSSGTVTTMLIGDYCC